MPQYKITLMVNGYRLETVKKRIAEVFPDQEATVEKQIKVTSRASRLAEAEAFAEDAKSIVAELKDEMEQWRDSIPENLQGGDKYSQVEETVSALEELEANLDQCEWGVEFPGMF